MAISYRRRPFDEICDELYLEFLGKFERSKEEENRFAPNGTAEEVLQSDVLHRFFRSLDWSDASEHCMTEGDLIKRLKERDLYNFLAILIFTTCNIEAARTFTTELLFKETFDSDLYSLPAERDTLCSLFGEEVTPDKFVAQQACFCPIIIHQGREQAVESPKRRRLPYLEEKLLSQGSFGKVYKVKIAKGHFQRHRIGTTSNTLPLEIARKDYVISSQFPAGNKDHEVLEKILASDRSCENIVENFGSLAIGSTMYSIFMPLAICDLSTYMMEYHRAKPSTTREKAAIILSARGLARGLHFLHHEMKTPQGEDLVCYHMDLKPSNILIFQNNGGEQIWKISDFGMARVKVRNSGGSRDKERDFNSWFVQRQKPPEPTPSPTFNPHGEGTYLAPESLAAIRSMKASSDVWSLGCVVSVLFVYLEDGADGVVQYRKERSDHPKADGIDRFFLRDKGFGPFKPHPIVKKWHGKLVRAAKRDAKECAALESLLSFLENSVFQDQMKRCSAVEVGDMLLRTFQSYSSFSTDVLSKPTEKSLTLMEKALSRLRGRKLPSDNDRRIVKWSLRTNEPFKNCEISNDGSLVVFWSDRKLTLFTSLSLSSSTSDAIPQAEWSLESLMRPNCILNSVRLTNRYLLATTSGGTFRVCDSPLYFSYFMDHLSNLIRSKCDVFSLKKGQSVDASFDYRRGFESQQPEISDIAISSDSKNMACILPGKEGAQKPASLYVAPVASANECTWVEELDWPATEISDLSFPTANDIYFVVRPKVSIRSHEDKAILAHVCHASKRLETVRIESAVSFSFFFFSFPFGYIESCLRILTIEILRALIIVEATSAFSLPSPPSMNCSIHVP
jgi:serine/threonine protein kinase